MKNIASSSTHHQQTTTPNLTPPGTSPPSEGLGKALFLFFFFPLRYPIKRQLPHLLTVHPFRDHAIYNEKYEVLQYFSHLTTHWNTIPPGTSPPPEGLGEALLLSLFYFGGAWGGRSFIFQIFPSTPPLAFKYWKYEHVIFRQDTPFLFFTAAAAASVDQFITFYFLSSLSPNTFLLSFFRCLFFTNFPRSLCFSVIV